MVSQFLFCAKFFHDLRSFSTITVLSQLSLFSTLLTWILALNLVLKHKEVRLYHFYFLVIHGYNEFENAQPCFHFSPTRRIQQKLSLRKTNFKAVAPRWLRVFLVNWVALNKVTFLKQRLLFRRFQVFWLVLFSLKNLLTFLVEVDFFAWIDWTGWC